MWVVWLSVGSDQPCAAPRRGDGALIDGSAVSGARTDGPVHRWRQRLRLIEPPLSQLRVKVRSIWREWEIVPPLSSLPPPSRTTRTTTPDVVYLLLWGFDRVIFSTPSDADFDAA